MIVAEPTKEELKLEAEELRAQLEAEKAACAELRERVGQITEQAQAQAQQLTYYEGQLVRVAPLLATLGESQGHYVRELEIHNRALAKRLEDHGLGG